MHRIQAHSRPVWRSAGSGETCQHILSRPAAEPDQAAEASICREVGRSLSESRWARISSARRSLYAATAVTATRHSLARSLACTQRPGCHRRLFTGCLEPCLCSWGPCAETMRMPSIGVFGPPHLCPSQLKAGACCSTCPAGPT